ncbi:hypothetical protein AMATHDRAFT_66191 [Amanita thiersii Skay4041]|uniref:Uncharacterized protein n=1 Tax=Amanita thiersii Skay4041 TaxID=703135 RepID=A0A2A9NIN2_9AGAR|nr:hypothetical protein AMATHDRAFT_66191 [Amanita thiersii Skay4041]
MHRDTAIQVERVAIIFHLLRRTPELSLFQGRCAILPRVAWVTMTASTCIEDYSLVLALLRRNSASFEPHHASMTTVVLEQMDWFVSRESSIGAVNGVLSQARSTMSPLCQASLGTQ